MKSVFVISRIGKLAVIGVMVAVAACTESTAPDVADDLNPVDGKVVPNTAVTSLGPWLPDATLYVVEDIETKPLRDKLNQKIKELSNSLTTYNTANIKNKIGEIRVIIAASTEDEQIILGPIEVALETIEAAMGII